MKMYLNLPDAKSGGPLDAWVEPKSLSTLLASPSFNLTERIQILSEATASLVHADVDQNTLIKCLHRYRGAVGDLQLALESQLVGLLLPVNSDDLAFCNQCSELYGSLAAICRRIILLAPQDFRYNAEDLTRISQACYWGILFLGERLRYSYCSYTQPPAGLWLEIHQIYQFSRTKKIAKHLLEGEESKLRNISHAYKRILLFGICDPYQFTFRDVHSVYRKLDNYAKLASLRFGRPGKETCLFLINPEADRPATPILPKLSMGVDTLYLDTSALVSVLNWDLDTTHGETRLKEKPREQIRKALETRELLKSLMLSWGIYASRGAKRKRKNSSCDCAFGLNSVAALLDLKNEEIDTDGLHIKTGLELVDESVNGARILLKEVGQAHVRVGEVVALKRKRANHWSVGMIRWAQTDDDNKFHFGVFKFIDNAIPVAISFLEDEKPYQRSIGVWATRNKANERLSTLIVDPKFYHPGDTIRVEQGDVQLHFEMGKAIFSTRYFVWFEAKLTDSTPERQSELITPLFALKN
ncbi:MAG: hypothetical protein QNI91_07755 [Arenicellales bacterium]|nr:hypothetical protein [Arenicellales bacterium]